MRPAGNPRNGKDTSSALAARVKRKPLSAMTPRLAAALLAFVVASRLGGAAPEDAWRKVTIEPTWTSIYVGTVSLRLPEFTRNAAGEYESTYTARVLPWFFQNETGRLVIRVSDEDLRRLGRGEPIEFTGRAVNHAGEERAVTGRANPADAVSGRIKVRVRVSSSVELIFNTTYRFTGH
jgi:hypothetical protein